MDVEESAEESKFRAQVRDWLELHVAGDRYRFRDRAHGETDAELMERSRPHQALLAEHRWAAITWPEQYGGRGGTATDAAIFAEEAAQQRLLMGMFAVGVRMAGPTIIAHGTDAQKERFLPPMLRGDEVWCQLFSEPGAGSDLAGLSTRAERDGDEWVVNGQKVWTSGADYSDYGILLARTDAGQPKHRGISYFLIDMHQPGVDVRPLRQITGSSHFSEVFLTDARVPDANLLGELNGGWAVAMTTLANERAFMGGGPSGPGVTDLIDLARSLGAASDPVVRQGLATAYSRAQIMRFMGLRVRTATSRGEAPGPEASVLKLVAAWNLKANSELAMQIEGAAGMLDDSDAPEHGRWQQTLLQATSLRIAGGSDEIQRNLAGERTLGLPPETRLDKGIAFRDIPRGTTR